MGDNGRYLDRIMTRAETDPMGAAMELGRGLMRGDRSELKLGYTASNAARAAASLIGSLDADGVATVEQHLHGYAIGMAEDPEQTYPAGPEPDAR